MQPLKRLFSVNCLYAGDPVTILVAEQNNGCSWYCLAGADVLFYTSSTIAPGIELYDITDTDVALWDMNITDLLVLEYAYNH